MGAVEYLTQELADRYTLRHELGRGGMARVFLAYDQRHERHVAIKVLHAEYAETIGTDRFLREIKTIAGLQHPHIVPLYDSGVAGESLFYVMPYVEGKTVRQLLNQQRQLPIADAVRIAREVADALHYAHERGIVHRDVKPENVLLSDGHAMLSDFGISRASDSRSGERLTEGRWILGTPTYMSPEQASGSEDVDGRADQYSLACVLYEMLAGDPPFAGESVETILAQQITEPPRPVRAQRSSVPAELDAVITTALAKARTDRFESAEAFGTALAGTLIQERIRIIPKALQYALGTAAAAVVLLASWLTVRSIRGPALDPSFYAVAPFVHRAGAAPDLITGDFCEYHVSTALERFRGLQVAGKWATADLVRRHGSPGHREWVEIARQLRAGRLIQGEVAQRGDTVNLRASLWDTRRKRQIASQSASFVLGMEDVQRVFERLTAALIDVPLDPLGIPATRDLPAAGSFVQGREALARFDLAEAARSFGDATARDPTFAAAHLALAETRLLMGSPADDWRASIVSALADSTRLGERQTRFASGLASLANGQFPQACATFAALATEEPRDVLAWIALADCHRLDSAVVRDTTSPSGWQFRASWNTAIDGYRRAVTLVPSFGRVFEARSYLPLTALLTTEPSTLRFGTAAAPDTGTFYAYTGMNADTLTFVPYPRARFSTVTPDASINMAMARNQAIFSDLVEQWARAFPTSHQAHLAAARGLELLGQISPDRYPVSALAFARRARALARDADERWAPAFTEVRLLLKSADFEGARDRALSTLADFPNPDPMQAHDLTALALLVGKLDRGLQLAERSAPVFRDPRTALSGAPLAVIEARERLRIYAALGVRPDSIRALATRLDTLLATWVEPAMQPTMRIELLELPMTLAFPTTGLSIVHRLDSRDRLLTLQTRLATGDMIALRRGLDSLRVERAGQRLGEVSYRSIYHEAWLFAQMGDTATATALLDGALGIMALPTGRAAMVGSPMETASFVRAAALRADLAAARGEREDAAAWARRVTALWRDADPELRQIVNRMPALR